MAEFYRIPTGTYPSRQRCCAVLARSANAAALAPIRLTNAASQLPYGSGETRGVLLLRSQAERKAASAAHSGEMKGEGISLHFINIVSPGCSNVTLHVLEH
jgi:hypothetical protein